jgi:transposase
MDWYEYIFVADRGFGNDRFIQDCLNNGFDVMIRLEPNMTIKTDGEQGIAEKILTKDGVYSCHIKSWDRAYKIVRHSKDDKVWFLLTNLSINNGLDGAEVYAKRFRIEKLFQNLKSSGFDIEKSKIKKYDRFKRMLFLSCFAQSILVLLGKFVNEKLPDIKKNSPICTNLLIASSSLEKSLLTTTQK